MNVSQKVFLRAKIIKSCGISVFRLIMLLKIIPLVVGSLGAIPKQFDNRLKQIGITAGTAQVQKIVLLGTARILRKVPEI